MISSSKLYLQWNNNHVYLSQIQLLINIFKINIIKLIIILNKVSFSESKQIKKNNLKFYFVYAIIIFNKMFNNFIIRFITKFLKFLKDNIKLNK